MKDTQRGDVPLLFMHLPKTAGGSVKELVERSFGAPDLYLFYNDDPARSAKEAREARLIYGHFIYGFHKQLLVYPMYTCFLRNPIERVISHYFHLKTIDLGPYGEMAREYRSVGEFVSRSNYWACSNMMCKMLTGTGDETIPEGGWLYRWAKQNMKRHFPIYGIYEYLPQSLRVFERAIGLRTEDLPVINKGTYRRDEIRPSDVQAIADANREDISLYAWAVRRFLREVYPNALVDEPLLRLAANPGRAAGPQAGSIAA